MSSVCLVARTNEMLDQYEALFQEIGLAVYRIRRSEPEDRSSEGIRITTMHRVKGLEFDRMIIAGVNEGIVPRPSPNGESIDQIVLREHEVREKSLLYVAATRSRHSMLLTSWGSPSRVINVIGG